MINFKRWFLVENNGFQTSQGSVYLIRNQGTQRYKTTHQYHDKTDIGFKTPSDKTVYIDPKFASEVGAWTTSNAPKKRVLLQNNKVVLLSWNGMQNKFGIDRLHYDPTFTLQPEVGKAPLELWTPDAYFTQSGMEVFKSVHPGNVIVKIAPIGQFSLGN